MSARVTIETVARRAMVSRQTVSNVLNAPDLVRLETRDRVRKAIRELGYRTSLAARQMRTGRSGLVAVRIDPVRAGLDEGAVLDRFLHGLTEAAATGGYRLMLYTAGDDASEIATFEELLDSYALDGFVLTHTHLGDARTAWLTHRGVRFTAFGRPWGPAAPHSWVDVDGSAGTAAATTRLITAGHRRIGYLGPPPSPGVGDDRRSGWVRAMTGAGLPTRGLVRHADDTVADAARIVRELGRLRQPPTAYVCHSDPMALGALRADPGARVIGFDDTPAAAAVGLTSVRQPMLEVASACIRLLVRQLDAPQPAAPSRRAPSAGHVSDPTGVPESPPGSPPPEPEQVLLIPELVVRDSG